MEIYKVRNRGNSAVSREAVADWSKLETAPIVRPVGRGSSDLLKGGDANVNSRRQQVNARVLTFSAIQERTLGELEAMRGWLGETKENVRVIPESLSEYAEVLKNPFRFLNKVVIRAMQNDDPRAQEYYDHYLEALEEACDAGLIDDTFFISGRNLVRDAILEKRASLVSTCVETATELEKAGLTIVKSIPTGTDVD